MQTKLLNIEGMSCQHCVMSLRKELSKLDLKILDIKIGSAHIEYDEKKITPSHLNEAITNAGFKMLSDAN
ncbi:MAG: heavy-metal-associated domain-containing protein [Ignavibacteriaceae bacterium]|nr:heavy-metal-associated domain-containing protein [Ignavibacteriaceae bacterium]